jgi:hypothetical protein
MNLWVSGLKHINASLRYLILIAIGEWYFNRPM